MNIWQVTLENYPHTQAFDTIALCLRESIRELGFESNIVTIPERSIVLGAHLVNEVPEGSIIYNLEQITSGSPLVNDNYIKMLKNNKVWDYSKRNIIELRKLGVNATHMPVGYHPSLTKIKNLPQNYSCLFYGSINQRRGEIFESISAHLRWGSNIYGEQLDYAIARSKIILNCHFYETKLFEIVRCSYLMANKKFILSEPGLDTDLEEPFRDGIAFHEKEEWPGMCKYYLANPSVREKIAQKGFEIFSKMEQTGYLLNESKFW